MVVNLLNMAVVMMESQINNLNMMIVLEDVLKLSLVAVKMEKLLKDLFLMIVNLIVNFLDLDVVREVKLLDRMKVDLIVDVQIKHMAAVLTVKLSLMKITPTVTPVLLHYMDVVKMEIPKNLTSKEVTVDVNTLNSGAVMMKLPLKKMLKELTVVEVLK